MTQAIIAKAQTNAAHSGFKPEMMEAGELIKLEHVDVFSPEGAKSQLMLLEEHWWWCSIPVYMKAARRPPPVSSRGRTLLFS